MNSIKILAIVMIIAGVLGLAYGGFSYTKDTHKADIGPLHLSVSEKEHVNVPMWAGMGILLAGVLMLAVPVKR